MERLSSRDGLVLPSGVGFLRGAWAAFLLASQETPNSASLKCVPRLQHQAEEPMAIKSRKDEIATNQVLIGQPGNENGLSVGQAWRRHPSESM